MKLPSDFKLAKNISMVLLMVAVAFIFSCNSGSKIASSFGKRKYTKGHFYDPIAKVKTGFWKSHPTTLVSEQGVAQAPQIDNSTLTKTNSATAKPHFAAWANTHLLPAKKVKTTGSPPVTATSSNSDNISQNISSQDFPLQADHMYSQDVDNMQHTYLLGWIICLAIVLLLFLILAAIGSGTFVNLLGCLYIGLIFIFFVGAITFFILWLVAIAK